MPVDVQQEASLLFVDGPILTLDPDAPLTDALAVVGNRIAAVGVEARDLRGTATRVVSLGGRVLVPGFVDAHNHFVNYGLRLMRLDLGNVRAASELLESLAQRAQMTPEDGWVVGHSWDESKWDDPALPTLADIDHAAGGRRVLLARVDRHGGLASSAALAAAGVESASGFVVEHEYEQVLRLTDPTLATLVKSVGAATRRAHMLGITSSTIMCSGDDFAALQEARRQGTLGVRASCFIMERDLEHAVGLGARRGLGDEWLRFLGLKLFADGSLGSHTAAVALPYLKGGRGEFMHTEGRLETLVKTAHENGLQVAVHAIGDRAAKRVLDAFEAADVQPKDRARIEHLEMVDEEDVARAARMGIVASVQPNFTGAWGHPGGMYEARLGWERARRLNRFRTYLEAGLPLAFGSDDMPLGPLYGIRSAVEAPEKQQRVDAMEALSAYTTGAAWAAFAEHDVGTLRPGMLADLVVLSKDPREDLAGCEVDLTLVDGRVVYERG